MTAPVSRIGLPASYSVTLCAPSSTLTENVVVAVVTSAARTHPVLPLGRIGSSTRSQSACCSATRNVRATPKSVRSDSVATTPAPSAGESNASISGTCTVATTAGAGGWVVGGAVAGGAVVVVGAARSAGASSPSARVSPQVTAPAAATTTATAATSARDGTDLTSVRDGLTAGPG